MPKKVKFKALDYPERLMKILQNAFSIFLPHLPGKINNTNIVSGISGKMLARANRTQAAITSAASSKTIEIISSPLFFFR